MEQRYFKIPCCNLMGNSTVDVTVMALDAVDVL